MVLTDTAHNIYLAADMLICIFTIIALGTAKQKKHYKAMGVIVFAFLLSLLLYSWIILVVSLGYIIISAIWFKSEKDKATTTKSEKAESESDEEKIKCRFCKKRYSSEFNGCPYCKKK